MAAAKRPRAPKRRKPSPLAGDSVLVPFIARLIENERAGLRCSCAFPDACDGSRLIHCAGNTIIGATDPDFKMCACAACPPRLGEHVTGCQGCEQCNKAVCGTCGKRSDTVIAEPDSDWSCSPECYRKSFAVVT